MRNSQATRHGLNVTTLPCLVLQSNLMGLSNLCLVELRVFLDMHVESYRYLFVFFLFIVARVLFHLAPSTPQHTK